MELLFSRIPPSFSFSSRDFKMCFDDLLMDSEKLKIATGFISQDSIIELAKFIEENKKPFLDLVIGMHHFDGITKLQYQSVKKLDELLRATRRGSVKICTAFPFHGKMYLFGDGARLTGSILGSSNLTKIIYNRTFEADIFLTEAEQLLKINEVIEQIASRATIAFADWEARFIERNPLLENLPGVDKIPQTELSEILNTKIDLRFSIPLKGDKAPKSNLNTFFGKGRESKRGLVKPRHWYEVELIVPKKFTIHPLYPKAGKVITVCTDDGWRFRCKISGQNSKNFRSEDDLKILGRWIKGRLENSGALNMGEPVTDAVLECYGRKAWELIATKDPTIWILNFGAIR